MEKITRLCILFIFMLFLAVPLFAEEAQEETSASNEGVMLPEELGEGVVTGEVVSLDATSGTITIKIEDGTEETFSVISEETILWRGIDDIELSDINKGEEVEVGYYTDENAKLIASWVDVLIEEESLPLELETDLEVEPGPEIDVDLEAETKENTIE